MFVIFLSSFPFISISYVIRYVALIVTLFSLVDIVSSDCLLADNFPTFKFPSTISIPSSCSSITISFKSFVPVFVTVIVYSITSPSCTSASFPMLTPFLFISATVFSISISAVSISSSFVGFPPTVAIFFILPSIDSTSTVNSLLTEVFASISTIQASSFSSSEIVAPSAEISFVPSGTLSVTAISPDAAPVFSIVIVYLISSPIFAVSTTSPLLVMTLVLFDFIIEVFVSLLSFPFAIAIFFIEPSSGISFPLSSISVSFTFTVNLAITVFPAGTVTTHFTPSTFVVVTISFLPTFSRLVSSFSALII